jgi:membrane protein implicated in regulation of membrane protease activity
MQETVIQVLSAMVMVVAIVLAVMGWRALRRALRRQRNEVLIWPGAAPPEQR